MKTPACSQTCCAAIHLSHRNQIPLGYWPCTSCVSFKGLQEILCCGFSLLGWPWLKGRRRSPQTHCNKQSTDPWLRWCYSGAIWRYMALYGAIVFECSCLNPFYLICAIVCYPSVLRHLALAGPCVGQCGFICRRNDVFPATGEQAGPPSEQLQISSRGLGHWISPGCQVLWVLCHDPHRHGPTECVHTLADGTGNDPANNDIGRL